MKAKRSQLRVDHETRFDNERVRKEIQSFLQALDSYPRRFARDPSVTFEEHRCALIQDQTGESRRV